MRQGEGIVPFIEAMIWAKELDGEYEVVSIEIIDEEWESYSLDEWTGIDSHSFFQTHLIRRNYFDLTEQVLNRKGQNHYLDISPTPLNLREQTLFYLPTQPVNFEVAMTFGLGVVKINSGPFTGKYMLYNHSPMDEDDLRVEDAIDELLMLKMYFQFTNPEYADKGLETILQNRPTYLEPLILMKKEETMERLRQIYREKKGGFLRLV